MFSFLISEQQVGVLPLNCRMDVTGVACRQKFLSEGVPYVPVALDGRVYQQQNDADVLSVAIFVIFHSSLQEEYCRH